MIQISIQLRISLDGFNPVVFVLNDLIQFKRMKKSQRKIDIRGK
jgi:hypothetical protein